MKKIKNKKLFTFALPASVILGAAIGIVWFTRNKPASIATTTPPPTASNVGADGVNYNPPTEQDKTEAENNKQDLANKVDQPTSTPPSTANVLITFSGQYDQQVELGASVSNVFEDNGVCTLTLTKDTLKLVKTSAGVKDARSTICTPFSVPRAEFAQAGQWTAVVSYTSKSITGTSQPKVIEVK